MSELAIDMKVAVEEEPVAVETAAEEKAPAAEVAVAPVREPLADAPITKAQVANDFILEVGVEEIPAWMIEPALAQLQKSLGDALKREVQVFGTPRRLVAYIMGLPKSQPDTQEQLTGPPKNTIEDRKASSATTGRLASYERCEKYRCAPASWPTAVST